MTETAFPTFHRPTRPRPWRYPGWYPLQVLDPHLVCTLFADLAVDGNASCVRDGEIFISTRLIDAFTTGNNDWLDGGPVIEGLCSEISIDD